MSTTNALTADSMDIEIADREPIRQATTEDLQRVLADEFTVPLALVRNYGDRLEVTSTGSESYRLAYFEATTGRWHEATAPLTRDEIADALIDYFQGNWHWHQRHRWRTM